MATPKPKAKAKVESATAFIHGRKEVKGKGANAETTTSVRFDKVLGNVGKLDIRDMTIYAEPPILEGDVAAFKVVLTPVTQEEYDEAMNKMFN